MIIAWGLFFKEYIAVALRTYCAFFAVKISIWFRPFEVETRLLMHQHCTLISRGVSTTTKKQEEVWDHEDNSIKEKYTDGVRERISERERERER